MQRRIVIRNINRRLKTVAPGLTATGSAPDFSEDRDRWIRGAIAAADLEQCVVDVRQGRLYTVQVIAKILGCSAQTTRRLFLNEPGILKLRSSLRVPETVLQRVLREIATAGELSKENDR